MDTPQTAVPSFALPRQGNIPELDGIRGIAILLVLMFHFSARPEGVPRIFTAPFALGWSGVDLFFVLSGFLITGILIDTKGASNYFSSFYARRVLRIFPLYMLCVVGYFQVIVPLSRFYGPALPGDFRAEAWFGLFLSNWRAAFGNDTPWLIPLWSVAVEEQFYCFWPLLMFAVPRARLASVCLSLILVSSALRYGFFSYGTVYPALLDKLTPFRLDTLACGGLMAVLVRNLSWRNHLERLLGWLLPAALVAVGAVFWRARTAANTDPFVATAGFTALAALYSLCVFAAYVKAGSGAWLIRQLRHPILRSFGKYSYGIYMLHFPLAIFAAQLLTRMAPRFPGRIQIALWIVYKVAGIGLCYAAALVSWRWIEQPFLRLKSSFVAKRRTSSNLLELKA